MCGICGWIGRGADPTEHGRAIALSMASVIAHRGPDGGGARELRGEGVSGWFAHRRLRVLDTSEAATPQGLRTSSGGRGLDAPEARLRSADGSTASWGPSTATRSSPPTHD